MFPTTNGTSLDYAYAPLPTSPTEGDQLALQPQPGGDIIQFSASICFGDEEEGFFNVDVIRLGNMRGQASVKYFTRDGSALAGSTYIHTQGELVFEDGEYTKSFEVQLLPSTIWSATMEFKILLAEPVQCQISPYLGTCRVKVIDRDVFPSNRCAGHANEVPAGLLYWELCKLLFTAAGVRWRTILTLICDQLENMNYVLMIALKVYLVNVVFNVNDPSTEELLLRSSRLETAYVIAAFYVLPMIPLHAWAAVRIHLDVDGMCTFFLRANLFRKYLNYTEEARKEVATESMQLALEETTESLANAYAASLRIIRDLSRLVLTICYTVWRDPSAVWCACAMPVFFCLWGLFREGYFVVNKGFGARTDLNNFTRQCCLHYELIADYFQRPKMNGRYVRKAEALQTHMVPCLYFELNSDIFFHWARGGFIATYLVWATPSILRNDVSLGAFVATVVIMKDMSSDLLATYKDIRSIALTWNGLRRITVLFNKPADVMRWKDINRSRRVITQRLRKEFMKRREASMLRPGSAATFPKFVTDQLPIIFTDVCWGHNCGSLLKDINLTVEQGSIVAIIGPPSSGKTSLASLLAHRNLPESGMIFVPAHLRILHVCVEPHIFDMSCIQNLSFGCPDPRPEDLARIKDILLKLHLSKFISVIEEDVEKGLFGSGSGSAGDASWASQLTLTEKNLLCLARAFIMNPEVMVMQRPLAQYNEVVCQRVLDIFAEHVCQKGLCMPQETHSDRRPRSLFYIAEDEHQIRIADTFWEMEKNKDHEHLAHLCGGPFDVRVRKLQEETVEHVGNLLAQDVDEDDPEAVLALLKGAGHGHAQQFLATAEARPQ